MSFQPISPLVFWSFVRCAKSFVPLSKNIGNEASSAMGGAGASYLFRQFGNEAGTNGNEGNESFLQIGAGATHRNTWSEGIRK